MNVLTMSGAGPRSGVPMQREGRPAVVAGSAEHRELVARAAKRLESHIAAHGLDTRALIICARYEGQERVLLGLASPLPAKRLAALDEAWADLVHAAEQVQGLRGVAS